MLRSASGVFLWGQFMAKVKSVKPTGTAPADGAANTKDSRTTGGDLELANDWIGLCEDDNTEFFDLLQSLPERAWDQLTIYMYRLEPAITNKQGEPKYIDVMSSPITQDYVKKVYGGGKYEAYLKYGRDTLRKHKFWIDGAAILQPGQKPGQRMNGEIIGIDTASPAPARSSELADVVRQVIEATGGNKNAENAGIAIMQKSFTDGITLNNEIIRQQIGSKTGSSLGDTLLEKLLARLDAPPPTPVRDPMMEKLMEAAITSFTRKENPRTQESAPAGTDSIASLGLIKDLFGAESLGELVEMVKGGRQQEQPWWAGPIMKLIENAPTLLSQYSAMQQDAFQRAFVAHNATRGALPAGIQSTTIPAAQAAPLPGVIPAQAIPGSQQELEAFVGSILKAWERGFGGWETAAALDLQFPEAIDSMMPILSDPAVLSNFIAQVPPLAALTQDPEWAEFQKDFLSYMQERAAPLVEETSTVTAPPATGPVPVIPGAQVVSAKTAAPEKAKPVAKAKAARQA